MKMAFSKKNIVVDKSKLPIRQSVPEYHMVQKNTVSINQYTGGYNMISLANSGKTCFPCDR